MMGQIEKTRFRGAKPNKGWNTAISFESIPFHAHNPQLNCTFFVLSRRRHALISHTVTMVGEEKRHQMMQNLFGDQSEEEEEEEEVESEHESNRQPDYASV